MGIVGKMIRRRRLQLGIRGVDLSSELGYSTDSFVHQIESGYKPPIEKIPVIAQVLKWRGKPRADFYKQYLKEFHGDLYGIATIAFKNSTNGKPKTKVKVETKLRGKEVKKKRPRDRVVRVVRK